MNTFEISESSLIIYKKYAEESMKLETQNEAMLKKISLSDLSTYTIISTPPLTRNNQFKQDGLKNQPVLKNKILPPSAMLVDPMRLVSERTLSIYLSHLSVGQRGAADPNEKNIRLYQDYVKQLLNEANI